jgi:peptidoglycan hydrolase-like protein with peptidoglycan-binding domain
MSTWRWIAPSCLLLALIFAEPTRSQGRDGPELMTIQDALAWIGHYDGPIDGRARDATRTAIVRFQRSEDLRATGHLTESEADRLFALGAAKRAAAGYRPYNDAATGISIGIPTALAPEVEQSEQGTRFRSADGSVEIELVRIAAGSVDGFRRAIHAGHPGLQATYSAGGRGWYVLTGYIGGRQFYSRARVERVGLIAFAVTYDSAQERTVEPAIVVMSSSFARPHILSMIGAPIP